MTTPSFVGLRPASELASRSKRANRKTGTKHELLLEKAIAQLGLRFQTHVADLPGCPDFVFSAARVVVFCDGDFWHGRNWRQLRAKLKWRHNAEYWIAKIQRNIERDTEQSAALNDAGWQVLRFWETDVLGDAGKIAKTVAAFVLARRSLKTR